MRLSWTRILRLLGIGGDSPLGFELGFGELYGKIDGELLEGLFVVLEGIVGIVLDDFIGVGFALGVLDGSIGCLGTDFGKGVKDGVCVSLCELSGGVYRDILGLLGEGFLFLLHRAGGFLCFGGHLVFNLHRRVPVG